MATTGISGLVNGNAAAGVPIAGSMEAGTPPTAPTPTLNTHGFYAPGQGTQATATPTSPTPTPSSTSSGPSAAQQAQDALNAKISELIITGTNAAQAGGTAGTASGVENITDLGSNAYATLENQQNAINEANLQTGVTQINSIKQLMNTIHDGLQGVGVNLGDSNALSSSAAGAAARAYANYGNVGVNTANNTAAVANQAEDVQQTDLGNLIAANKTQLDAARDAAITSITAQAAQALDSLQTQITYLGGDPNSVPVQNIKNGIIQSAQDDLATVDQNYQNMLNGIIPATATQTEQAAESASNAGVLPSSETPFQTTSLLSNPETAQTQTPAATLIPLTLGPVNGSGDQNQGT